jgi:hypothetical protein
MGCGTLAAVAWFFGEPQSFDGAFALWPLLPIYVVLAFASGILVGLLRPTASSYAGAMPIGAIMGCLAAGEMRFFILGLAPPQSFDGFLLGFLGIVGCIIGVFWHLKGGRATNRPLTRNEIWISLITVAVWVTLGRGVYEYPKSHTLIWLFWIAIITPSVPSFARTLVMMWTVFRRIVARGHALVDE